MKTVGDGTKGQYPRRAIARKKFDIATWNSVRLLVLRVGDELLCCMLWRST
jgi:hypothetical protein